MQKFLHNGLSKSSITNFYGVLSGSLKYPVYPCNYIKENPMYYVTIPKYDEAHKESKDLKIITTQEFSKIIERFPIDSRFYIPLQIGFNTGIGGREIVALTWNNVDLDNGIL